MAEKKDQKETKVEHTQKQEEVKTVQPQGKAAEKYEFQELKQKQSVLNLDTNEDAEIEVVTKKLIFKDDVSENEKLAILEKLVSPAEKRIAALVKFYESESYQESKKTALASGNFMNSSLRSTLTGIMSNLQIFAENKASDNFKIWLAGYKAKKQSAVKLLETAKAATNAEDYSDLVYVEVTRCVRPGCSIGDRASF